jgi:hypothetical protein
MGDKGSKWLGLNGGHWAALHIKIALAQIVLAGKLSDGLIQTKFSMGKERCL